MMGGKKSWSGEWAAGEQGQLLQVSWRLHLKAYVLVSSLFKACAFSYMFNFYMKSYFDFTWLNWGFSPPTVRGSKPGKNVQLQENEIRGLCLKSREIFLSQPILLELEAPLKICGDIHGQYYDLLRLFEYGGFPPESNYLFLGDYVDRGKQSLETICLLLAYKIKYPEEFFLLRGNHECASINRIYGFYDECKRRYNIKLWKTFTDCFNCLPIAAIVDEKIFCCHGGLSPNLQSMEQIWQIMWPTDVPDQGLLCDLL